MNFWFIEVNMYTASASFKENESCCYVAGRKKRHISCRFPCLILLQKLMPCTIILSMMGQHVTKAKQW